MKTAEKIMKLLKTHGAMTTKILASELSLTTMGVRQHLQLLEQDSQVIFEDKKAVRGRPTRYWHLTTKSNSYFPDGHEELTVQLIDSIQVIFGEKGLDELIEHRDQASLKLYRQTMVDKTSLGLKLEALVKLRNNEGYMASLEKNKGAFWLLENHCPICAAATKCLNFCRSELNLFQTLLENLATISREEHIIEGARRCAYKIIPL